jgi:hypothetical protein
MSIPQQRRAEVSPIYEYVKEIIEADIDALPDPYQLKETYKKIIKKLNLHDKMNLLLSNMGNDIFLAEKVGGDTFFLPAEFLDIHFIRVSDETSQVRPTALGGNRKTKTKTRKTKKRKTRRRSLNIKH